MSSRKRGQVGHDEAVRKAIAYADKWAGNDDRAFIDAVEQHYRRAVGGRSGGERGRSAAKPAPGAAKSFHISEDPRFLKNARELARRTLGGARVMGGTKVPPGQFLHCVAVGADDEWNS